MLKISEMAKLAHTTRRTLIFFTISKGFFALKLKVMRDTAITIIASYTIYC